MDEKKQLNENAEQIEEEKPKNFWQKTKPWQRVLFIITPIILFILIIQIFYCSTVDLDLTKHLKYISCATDNDCYSKSCGCLNKQGASRFKFLSGLCLTSLQCVQPECSCQNRQCVGSYNNIKNIDLFYCEEDDDCTETFYEEDDCCGYCMQFPISKQEKIVREKWRSENCDPENEKCPLYKCLIKEVIPYCENNQCMLKEKSELAEINCGGYEGLECPEGYYCRYIDDCVDCYGVCKIDDLPEDNTICSQDLDCEANFSNCDCQYHCTNKNGLIEDCGLECLTDIPDKPNCVCENNQCVSKELNNNNEMIKNLIKQMGDDSVAQKIKNEIPEKLYNYNKDAIPYLINALDDERIFDPCLYPLGGYEGQPCSEVLVKNEASRIIKWIITPLPSLNLKYPFFYNVDNWQDWWNENQDKTINEIRKMVRDYYRSEEKKNNYQETGYRDSKYDYLDIVDYDHDTMVEELHNKCLNFSEPEQCDYLEWPIDCGCLIVDKDDCYTCLAEKEKDNLICDYIENTFSRDNCYWAVVVKLGKAGMNNKINFCNKFTNTDITKGPTQEACLESANK